MHKDEKIKQDIINQLVWDDRIDASKVTVEIDNGKVTLNGRVPSYFAKTAAEMDALNIHGVTAVDNLLVVEYAPLTNVPDDSVMVNNLRSKLANDPNLNLADLGIFVDAGIASLKGTVNSYWKKIHAENIIETEPGIIGYENHIAVVPTEDIIDKEIANQIVESLERKALLDADRIEVRVDDGNVTLTGAVESYAARRAAYESALFTAGVIGIEDHLTVGVREQTE